MDKIILLNIFLGFMYDIASDFNALIVFAEHRFYGETQPFGLESYTELSNLGYCTSEQALADYAQFIRWLKNEYYPASKDSQVIAFGGSYGGLLSAWMRMKYPHIVSGSLAVAAPMLMWPGLSDCAVFPAIVTRTFKNSGDHCDECIQKSFSVMINMSLTANGRQSLNDIFRLCPDTSIKEGADVFKLFSFLYSIYLSLSEADYPYPASFFKPLPGWPAKVACSYLTNPNVSDIELLTGVYNVVNLYMNYTGDVDCYTMKGADSVMGQVPWHFQVCSELVAPFCSNSSTMFYSTTWNLNLFPWNFTVFSDYCENLFHVRPRENWAVTEYGADHIQASSNIIFSNGDLDPTSGCGILSPIEGVDSIHIIYIKNGAHHYDLRGGNPNDTEDVLQARATEYNIIKAANPYLYPCTSDNQCNNTVHQCAKNGGPDSSFWYCSCYCGGGPCKMNADCSTNICNNGICASTGGKQGAVCSSDCGDENQCAPGYECQPWGDFGYCNYSPSYFDRSN